MSRLGDWFNNKAKEEARIDVMIYGFGCYHIYYRYPWNPLRYILGEVKITRLNPTSIVIKARE